MPLYRTFYVLKKIPNQGVFLRAKTFDICEVESFEYVDDWHTRVIMKSGDKFTVKCPTEDFGNIVLSGIDGYGKLFTFNLN